MTLTEFLSKGVSTTPRVEIGGEGGGGPFLKHLWCILNSLFPFLLIGNTV